MYAGRVACCPLVSHSEYTDWTDRQTDGRQTVTLRFPPYASSVMSVYNKVLPVLDVTLPARRAVLPWSYN